MKTGDLVKFETNSWVMRRDDYANPGVILGQSASGVPQRYRVMWADQKITVEHISYLKLLSKGDKHENA